MVNGGAAVIRNLPSQMRSRRIADTRKASGFRHLRRRSVSIGIVACEERLAARLTRHAHVSDEIIRCGACDATRRDAAVAVAIEDSAFVVDCDLIKIEQIPVLRASPLLPDPRHALNRIVRRGVDGPPGNAAVISSSDECIPFAWETICLVIAVNVGP